VPKDESNSSTPDNTLRWIIHLGEELASISRFTDQKNRLLEVIQNRFRCEAYIRLTDPPKSLQITGSQINYPFTLESIESTTNLTKQGYVSYASAGAHWLILPLTRGEEDFGRLILKGKKPFEDQDRQQLQDISDVAGWVIFATIQTELQNWRQRQLALVGEVSRKISQITDLNLLTSQITQLVQETFTYSYVAVFLIDPDSQRLKFYASAISEKHSKLGSEPPEFEKDSHPGFSLGEHMIGFVAQTGQELIANDVTQEPRYKEVDSLDETRSEVVLPLKIESQVLGVFDVQSDKINAFNEDDLLVLRSLADNISVAIESTRLYEGMQIRMQQLATVSEVSRAITYILDIDELLQQIVTLIQNRFGFPHVHLYTVDPVQNRINFKSGSGEDAKKFQEAGASFDIASEKGILSWVGRQGKTRRVNDVTEDPLYIKSPYIDVPIGSEMAVPLRFGGETLGVLDIHSNQTKAFSASDQQLIETLGDNIAIAIRNARLYRSERWRRQIAESLRDVAGLLSENKALDELLETILSQLHKNLPCDIASIWLFDAGVDLKAPIEKRKLYLAAYQASEGFDRQEFTELSFIPDEWVIKALSQKEPSIRNPEETQGPIALQFNLPQEYSSIAAPLYTSDELLGMLTLDHHTPDRYGVESKRITSAFASYAAVAIKNARLYATSQEQAWIATILLQVATATQSMTNIEELASTIVRLTPMVVGVKGCALFLRGSENEIFSLHASYGIGELAKTLDDGSPILLENAPILEELALTQEVLHVRDPEADFGLSGSLSTQMEEDNLVLYPISSREEILGAFLIAHEETERKHRDAPGLMAEERFRIIQGIVQQTAVALENIRLLEEKQEEAYVSTVLLQSAQAVVSSGDLDDTLDSIVHIMPILVGIEASVIYFWGEEEKKFKPTHATTKSTAGEEDLLALTYDKGDFPMLDTVFQHNRPIVFPFIENPLPPEDWDLVLPDEGQIDPTPILQTRYPLLMGFPLSMKDEVFGVLLAQDTSDLTNRERHFELLWGMAQQASLAIQNDRLNQKMIERQRLEREFQLAREIQQTFLPNQTPEIPGWNMDVLWETARQVGGDFYDYFLLPDGRLAFVIADVSDKGLAASLYMTVTRTLLRAAALEYTAPAETLKRVNDLLLGNSQNGLFVTTFYGVLSLNDGTLTYAIAGHNPPMIIRYDEEEIEEMEKGGVALGALPDIEIQQKQSRLNPGDCLVLYTDGVTEAFNFQDQMYGEKRLIKVLQSAIRKNAANVLSLLKADLEDFRGNAPLSDDTTILAICRDHSLADQNG
jgi:phosphoserine phosphatase RsbU/P